jgi:hypothetical protein
MLWPWYERLEALKKIKNFDFDKQEFPKLTTYITRMHEQPAVKEVSIPTEVYEQFFRIYSTGEEPNYDIGLKSGA